jgi:hypothetical protein
MVLRQISTRPQHESRQTLSSKPRFEYAAFVVGFEDVAVGCDPNDVRIGRQRAGNAYREKTTNQPFAIERE